MSFTHTGEVLANSRYYEELERRETVQSVDELISELCDGDKNVPSRDAIETKIINKWRRK